MEGDRMKGTKRGGNFLICLLLNMVMNLRGAIPAVVLLILHFGIGLSLWWSFIAFGIWILGIIIWMLVIGWAGKCSNKPDPPKENKNPYSARKI